MITEILTVLFLALVVIFADLKMTKHNLGVVFNGVGAVPLVLMGKSSAPMQYRVLVPWLCLLFSKFFGRGNTDIQFLNVYLPIKRASITFALLASYWYFSIVTATPLLCVSLLSAFFVLASIYDYTDVYIEVGLVSLSLVAFVGGMPAQFVMPLVFLAAINRETAIFIPAVFLAGGNVYWVGAFFFFALGYAIPRLIYGQRRRYCEFFMLWANLDRFIGSFKGGRPLAYNEYIHFVILLLATISIYLVSWPWTSLEWVALLFCGGLLVPTMWNEIRVFSPAALAIIPMVIR